MAGQADEERLAQLPAAATAELIVQYERAAKMLRSLIAGAVRRGALGTAEQRRKQLAAVKRALADLERRTAGLAAVSVLGGYRVGAQFADLSAEAALPASVTDRILEPEFAGGANRQAMQAMQLATERKLGAAIVQVGRSAEDVFRRVGLEEVTLGVGAGLERRETSRRIVDKFAGEGIGAFVDRGGRTWKLDTYARMVARTVQREAASLGTLDRMSQVGLDLVKVSDHNTKTAICKEFEGKVFSISGKTRGYKKLKRPAPFHPNCKHVIGAAAENLQVLGFEIPEAAAA